MKARGFLVAAVVVVLSAGAWAQGGWPAGSEHQTLNLWPKNAPDAVPTPGPEGNSPEPNTKVVGGRHYVRWTNVTAPTLTLYAPKGQNTGAAVVVFPGGGYKVVSMDLEGTEVCDWLSSKGITCLILKYRVPGTGPYPQQKAALDDAQRAVGLVREHAAEWKIDPKRVGVLGFSAGAHLAAALSTHYDARIYPAVDAADQLSCRPDFAAIIYPAYVTDPAKNFAYSPDLPVTKNTPPAILVQAENDPVHVENAIGYFQALKAAGVPAELHLFAEGGHGYGLRRTELPVTNWPSFVETWLKTIKMVP